MTTSVEDILMFDKYPPDQMLDKKGMGGGNHGQYIYDQEPVYQVPTVQSAPRMSPQIIPVGPPPAPQYRCVDIYEHISSCPICMKMYNTDKTPYYIIIVMLSLVCILLLKKVLEK
jgi:hypothetical protein